MLTSAITELAPTVAALPLSNAVKEQFIRLEKQVKQGDGSQWQITGILVREFHMNVLSDLYGHCYLLIPSERRSMYEQQQPPFGRDVENAFPDAGYDIAAASRCLALDEWTACVFHLMRASELALRVLARRLKIKYIELKEWAQILRDVDGALAAMGQMKKSTKRQRQLKYYSEARADLAGFKDAWRNHVMHSHEKYDERQATVIYGNVKALMQHLARGP